MSRLSPRRERSGALSPSASTGAGASGVQSAPFAHGDRSVLNQVPFPRVHSLVRVRPWTEKEAKTVPDKQAIPRPGLELCGPDEYNFRTGIMVLDPVNRFKPRSKGRFECDTVLWSFVDDTLDPKSETPQSPSAGGQGGTEGTRPPPSVPATQADVYNHAGAPLVDCICMGYNVGCVVTGPPNTEQQYTLWGDEYWAGDPRGIIPRFLFDLFERQQKAYREDMDSKVELEVYAVTQENIADMLRKTKVHPGEDALKVREDAEGVHVIGGTRMAVEDVLSVEAPLKTAIQKYNKHHSNGHLIINIRLTDIWTFADPENPEASLKKQRVSLATFVLVNGPHLVFQRCLDAAISRDSGEAPQAKVPTRDSNLTKILADIFGGNCNLSYVHCVSPYYEHTKDAMTTLGFASKVAVIKCRSTQNTDNSMSQLRKLDDEVRGLAAATAKENDTIIVVQNELDRRTDLLREKQKIASDMREAYEAQDADREEKQQMLRAVSDVRIKHQKRNQEAMERDFGDKTSGMRKEEGGLDNQTENVATLLEKDKEAFAALEATMAAELAKTAITKTEIEEHQAFEGEVAEQQDIVATSDSRKSKLKDQHNEKMADWEKSKATAAEDAETATQKKTEVSSAHAEVQAKHVALMKRLDSKKEQERMLETLLEEEGQLQKDCDDLDEEIKKLKDEKAKQGCCVVQ